MDELEQYKHGTRQIFFMAVLEQKQIDAGNEDRYERLKAYRIALHFLRPDLTEDEIADEIERVSRIERQQEADATVTREAPLQPLA